jgi:hypothetical protein
MVRDIFPLMSVHQRQLQHSTKPILWRPELLRICDLVWERSVGKRDGKVDIDRLPFMRFGEDEGVQQCCKCEDSGEYC